MASAKLTKTYSSTGNRRTYTLSLWVKFSSSSSTNTLVNVGPFSGDNEFRLSRNSDGKLEFHDYGSSAYKFRYKTNRLLRDTNAWYHIVCAVDTTQGTSGDRIKIYINGSQETSFTTSSAPSQNLDTDWGLAQNYTLAATESGNYMDGEITHFHYVDGTAHTPSTFGETDATTGIWRPKTSPSVTYGTNGFFLKFDNSANMGLDSGGGGNNWTTNGTIIQTKDTPSNIFATWNSLVNLGTTNRNIANVATTFNTTTTAWGNILSTLAFSKGKYYAEFKFTALQSSNGYGGMGITDATESYDANDSLNNHSSTAAGLTGDYRSGQSNIKSGGSTVTSNIGDFTSGDIIGLAADMDNKALYIHKNGTYYQISSVTGVPTSGASKTGAVTIPASCEDCVFWAASYTSDATITANFGNGYFGTTAVTSAQNPDDGEGIFEYDVPAGYRALCTKSLNATEYS